MASKILLGAGVLLFIDLFLDWQQVCVSGINVCGSASGWTGIGVLTGLLVIALIAWEAAQLAGVTKSLNVNVPGVLVTVGLAAAVALFTVIEFLTHSTARHWPAWLGLILALVIAYGGWLRYKDGVEPVALRQQGPPPAL